MNLLIGVMPALLWGSNPIIMVRLGGTPLEQLVGACYGQLIAGFIVWGVFQPFISFNAFIWCFISGLSWAIAALTQFMSFRVLNVSRSMPISTGLQLIVSSFAGIIFWHEWPSISDKIMGFIAIVLLIIGLSLISVHKASQDKLNYKKGLPLVFMCALGFVGNAILPKIPNVDGITGIFPMALGMFVGAVAISIGYQVKRHHFIMVKRHTLENIVYGLVDTIGSVFYLTSLKLNGPANAFPLTGLTAVVATLGGIFILHESKTHRELVLIMAGLILMITGVVIIGSNT